MREREDNAYFCTEDLFSLCGIIIFRKTYGQAADKRASDERACDNSADVEYRNYTYAGYRAVHAQRTYTYNGAFSVRDLSVLSDAEKPEDPQDNLRKADNRYQQRSTRP